MLQVQLSSCFSLSTKLSIHPKGKGRTTQIIIHKNHDKNINQLPAHQHLHKHSPHHHVLSLSNNDFDDFSMEDVQAANELTKEFYQQIKLRQKLNNDMDIDRKKNTSDNNTSNDNDDDEIWEMKNKQTRPSSSNSSSSSSSSSKKRKLTGRFSQGDLDSTGTPSAGLFATQNGSVYAVPAKRPLFTRQSSSSSSTTTSSSQMNNQKEPPSSRDKIMTQEFNILSIASNELALLIQILFVSITLCFAIYIGLSGGITDGSDRFGGYDVDMGNNENGVVNTGSLIRNGDVNGDGGTTIGGYYDNGLSITSIIEESVKKQESSSVWL